MAAEIESSKDVCIVAAKSEDKALTPKLAWGNVAAPIATTSLSEVMSEQLATEMYQKEVTEKKKIETIDENLAKALQNEESLLSESVGDNTLNITV